MADPRLIRDLRRLVAEWSKIRDGYMVSASNETKDAKRAEYCRLAAAYELCSDLVRCAIGDKPLYLDSEEVRDQMVIFRAEPDLFGIGRELDRIDLANLADHYPELCAEIERAIDQGATPEVIGRFVGARGKPAAWVGWLEGAARALAAEKAG